MNIYAIGAFSITAFNLILWFLTFFGRRLSDLAQAFFWWSFFVTIWAFGYGITLSGVFDYQSTLYWNKFCQSMAAMIAPFFYKYCAVLAAEEKKTQKWFYFYLISFFIFGIGIGFTDYFVRGLWSFGASGFQPLAGSLYIIFILFFHIGILHGFFLVLSRFQLFSEVKKKQLRLFLITTGLSYFGGGALFIAPFGIPLPSYGVFLILVYVFATGYAIHKYQFLDFPSLIRSKEAIDIHNEKLALVGLISSSINHEIRNPLFMLQELLKKLLQLEVVAKSSEALQITERANVQLMRMGKLVDRLGAFVRPGELNESSPEAVGLHLVIENALFFAAPELKYQNITTRLDISDQVNLKGDKSQFEVIFLNLIINAYHAMPNGGTLTVIASPVGAKQSLEITISDTGTGIPKEELKNIFKPFYTTKQKTGTGLGLHIVKTLVEQNGGKISVESEVGTGTEFRIQFKL